MPLSFLSDALKSQAQGALDDVHVTLGKQIVAYKDAQKNVVALTPEYNHLYSSAGSASLSVSKQVVSGAFTARVKFVESSEEMLTDGNLGSQFKISLPEGSVRIKVGESGFNFLQDAKRVELNGKRYTVINDSVPRTIGPFTTQYYAFYLSPMEENG